MKIALDFDDTYTEDPELWNSFISLAKKRGHSVAFVTYRDERFNAINLDIRAVAENLGIEVVFTGGSQKATKFCANIWIDDNPVTIPSTKQLGDMYDGCLINNDMEDELV